MIRKLLDYRRFRRDRKTWSRRLCWRAARMNARKRAILSQNADVYTQPPRCDATAYDTDLRAVATCDKLAGHGGPHQWSVL